MITKRQSYKMITKRQSGICPRCGSTEIEYVEIDWLDWDLQRSKCICDRCDLVFQEYFQNVYDGFSFKDQNGESHAFDENGNEL